MIRKIVRWPNPILTTMCEPVDFLDGKHQDAKNDLFNTFVAHSDAAGLAAPQIGYPLRMLAMRLSRTPVVMCNPEVLNSSSVHRTAEEGCLSMPWLKVKVSRPHSVRVRWTRFADAERYAVTLYDFDARVFLHELDHLNGITLEHHRRAAKAARP